ncbi:thiol-disulfide isomerase/thioredoxin [Mucilaginibacter oryzae]|uniref:Thiol-disulfide isomerase/thioredoxin n=1 Tax=Mucilaginibacter oryzae TaxID=468058 RepID=A0A316H2D2_9SPHI|nr:TlpA disulfide reductase family protein [Mucilaginibacter oryzae]PWK72901.1 thiol-disulfide isomerase/thioredoxin [Mucilaginibacter oryzae]
MKRFFSFLALLCLFSGAGAQDKKITPQGKTPPAALQSGDKLPQTAAFKALNNGGKALHLDAFQGKLLIIDFWATSCSGCIQGMPRIDSLQKVFGHEVAIIPVTYEKAEAVTRFQASNAFLKKAGVSTFRTVVEDKVLHQLFPHRLLPHEAWISKDGVVLGFTDGTDVTAANIRKVLAGGPLPVPEKRDVLDYDKSKLLMVNGNGAPDSAFSYRSIFSGEIRGINSGLELEKDTLNHVVHVRATNVDARYLYILAFKQLRFVPRSQVDISLRPGLFCYEMTMPLAPAAMVREAVHHDLDRFLGVHAVLDSAGFRLVPLPEDDSAHEPLSL